MRIARGRRTLLLLAVAALVAAGSWLALERLSDRSAPSEASTPAPIAEAPAPAPDNRPADTAPRRRLYLEVLSDEHAPVAGARVRAVAPLLSREAFTDAQGLAILDDVPTPLSRLEAAATGYQAQTFVAPKLPDSEEVSWTFELPATDESARFVRGAVLGGGAPVEGALVVLLAPDEDARLDPSRIALTDATGRFVGEVPPSAVSRAFALHREHGLAEVRPEGARELTFELPPGGFLEGTVVDASGRPAARYDLRVDVGGGAEALQRAFGAFWRLPRELRRDPAIRRKRLALGGLVRAQLEHVDDEGGRFRVGPLPPGPVSLTARADGSQPASLEASAPSGEIRGGLVIRLSPPLVVTGRVTDALTKAPVVGATVTAEGAGQREMPGFAGTVTDDEGRFRLATTSTGRHTLAVSARGYLPLDLGGIEGRAGDELRRDMSLQPATAGSTHTREYVGVGATLGRHEDGARVESVFDDGPAAAFLSPGDVILRVDGVWVRGRPLREIVQRIVGEPGTEVELLLRRAGESHTERVSIPRRRIATDG